MGVLILNNHHETPEEKRERLRQTELKNNPRVKRISHNAETLPELLWEKSEHANQLMPFY